MNSDTIKPGNYVTGSIFCTYGQGAEFMGGGKFRALFLITESRPLKGVAREKWGTHDALRAQ